jgi:phage baseplate assembly protein W
MMTNDILGTGWKFPVRINSRGGFALSAQEQDVAESIWLVLASARGERLMLPDFGCGVHDYVFAPNNASTRGAIGYQVQQALVRWEPRIDVVDVRVVDDPAQPNLLLIAVDYRIRANNALHNLVYPFFLQEGQTQP